MGNHNKNLSDLTFCSLIFILSSVQFSHSVVPDSLGPHGLHSTLGLLEFSQTHVHRVVMPSNHLILSSPFPPAFNLSQHQDLFQGVLRISWPKYWSLSFSISPSSEYSGLISFRIDRFDLLPVQGTLESLLQHHSSKASILQCSAFFMVQLSHPYMTTGKTIALTRWTFVRKVNLCFLICCLG